MRRLIQFVALSLAVATAVQAQDYGSYSYPGTDFYANNNTINVAVMNDVISGKSQGKASGRTADHRTEIVRGVSAMSLNYTASKSRTRTNLQNFVTKTRASDPEGAARMASLFASSDIIGQIGGAMRSIGLRADNAADAYALYWVSAWKASRGDTETASAATYQAVAAQAADGLANSSEFARASDAQKQEMAEAMMIQAALIDGHMEVAEGNDRQMEAVAQAVSQGAAAAGLDLGKMTLTEQGFVSAAD